MRQPSVTGCGMHWWAREGAARAGDDDETDHCHTGRKPNDEGRKDWAEDRAVRLGRALGPEHGSKRSGEAEPEADQCTDLTEAGVSWELGVGLEADRCRSEQASVWRQACRAWGESHSR